MDGECGDENALFDTKPDLNLIEVGSWVLRENLVSLSIFIDSRTTLQGRFWWHNITIDLKVEILLGHRARRDIKNVCYGLQVHLSK